MKLQFSKSPNPRRVLIFAAEKRLQLDVVNVDLRGGETKSPTFLTKNPSGKIPVLEWTMAHAFPKPSLSVAT